MQCPSHVGEHAPIDMSCLDSRSNISLKIRDQTGRVGVPAVGAVAQALQQLLQQKQITEGKRFIVPPGGMWRATPSKATKISRGELSRYRSRSGVSAGGRPLAIAAAMRLACRSIGEDFGWARLITLPPRIAQCYPRSCASLIKTVKSTADFELGNSCRTPRRLCRWDARHVRSPAKPPMNFLTIRGQYP